MGPSDPLSLSLCNHCPLVSLPLCPSVCVPDTLCLQAPCSLAFLPFPHPSHALLLSAFFVSFSLCPWVSLSLGSANADSSLHFTPSRGSHLFYPDPSCFNNRTRAETNKHFVIRTKLLLFSCYIVSNPLQPHELQHTRLPSPSLSPRVCSNSCVRRVSDTIQSSHPLSPPSPLALTLSQHQGLFQRTK